MNENVTNKTPKRRRWIARLLVSALCILLASSLLFVGVVADNIELVAQFTSSYLLDVSSAFGFYYLDMTHYVYASSNALYFCGSDGTLSSLSLTFSYYPSFYRVGDVLYCSFVEESISLGRFPVLIEIDISNLSSPSVIRSRSLSSIQGYVASVMDSYISFCIYDGLFVGFCYTGYTSQEKTFCRAFVYSLDNGENHFVSDAINLTFGVGSDFELISNSCFVDDGILISLLAGKGLSLNTNSFLLSFDSEYSSVFFYDGLYYVLGETNLYSYDSSLRIFEVVGASPLVPLCAFASNGVLYCATSLGTNSRLPYTVYTGLPTTEPPPESSDETTTEPPPESSEESSAGGVIDLYSYDRLSDGTYESALIGTLDLTDATGLRVFLGMYLLGDNVWSDIKTPLTLLVYREDGSLDTYTYDYYAAGFAWGSGSPGSFTFPKFIGGYFDIPLNSSSELYFASSAPGGTIWLQNNSVVLRQINLLNSDSYVELENVSAEECIISVYDSPSDDDPESFVYTSGVLKYTLRKRNSSSSIPVSLDYGETGIVHGVMKYNGADFTVSSIILASDPDLMPPIYDFESMDNALSEAYDDVSRQQYLENLLTSYIENAYGTVSYDPDTSGAFLGGVDLMGDIVDSSGGSTIISAFVNMWSIHPFFPAMVGLLGTFLIFSFFLRKA